MSPWRERRAQREAERLGRGLARGAGGEVCANSRPRVRAEASCKENPGLECGGDGKKPEPATRKNASFSSLPPVPGAFVFLAGGWRGQSQARASPDGPRRPAGQGLAPEGRGPLPWLSPPPVPGGALFSVQRGGEISAFSVLFSDSVSPTPFFFTFLTLLVLSQVF